jgi:hypothetical protein
MKLQMVTHQYTLNPTPVPIEGDAVRFIADDGSPVFEVRVAKDGKSIDVRAVVNAKIEGVLHAARLLVAAEASNSLNIRVPTYEAEWGR